MNSQEGGVTLHIRFAGITKCFNNTFRMSVELMHFPALFKQIFSNTHY